MRLSSKSGHLSPAFERTHFAWHHVGVSYREPGYEAIPRAEMVGNGQPVALHASFTTRLNAEQLEALRRCAKGISLRFEAWAIVNALVDGGYAEKGVAGVITITPKGKEYVRMQAL